MSKKHNWIWLIILIIIISIIALGVIIFVCLYNKKKESFKKPIRKKILTSILSYEMETGIAFVGFNPKTKFSSAQFESSFDIKGCLMFGTVINPSVYSRNPRENQASLLSFRNDNDNFTAGMYNSWPENGINWLAITSNLLKTNLPFIIQTRFCLNVDGNDKHGLGIIYFQTSFPYEPVVVCSVKGGPNNNHTLAVFNVTTTSFQIYCSNGWNSEGINYIAICKNPESTIKYSDLPIEIQFGHQIGIPSDIINGLGVISFPTQFTNKPIVIGCANYLNSSINKPNFTITDDTTVDNFISVIEGGWPNGGLYWIAINTDLTSNIPSGLTEEDIYKYLQPPILPTSYEYYKLTNTLSFVDTMYTKIAIKRHYNWRLFDVNGFNAAFNLDVNVFENPNVILSIDTNVHTDYWGLGKNRICDIAININGDYAKYSKNALFGNLVI
jgi:hypothetical protein